MPTTHHEIGTRTQSVKKNRCGQKEVETSVLFE